MFPTPILRALAKPKPYWSPFKAKKTWPPDFAHLPAKYAFRLEKRYRRRLKRASQRPRWDRFIKMVQFVSISGVLIWGVLFADKQGGMVDKGNPFEPFRKWFFGYVNPVFGRDSIKRPEDDASPTAKA